MKLHENDETKKMEIAETPCWKCSSPMKVAMIALSGPESFNQAELEFARSKGVIIEMKNSETMGESYLANTCSKCGAFIGQFFVHEYVYTGEVFNLPS